jgi:tetratricopeptide (TPR) repeat protein
LRHVENDGPIRARHFTYFLELVESLKTSWNTSVEPLWSNPIGADLANVNAAMIWALDRRDAEGALRMADGLYRFWAFSFPPPAARRAWLEAALGLPWSPSSVIGIRARANAYHRSGLMKSPSDPVAAQGLHQQGLMLFEQIGDDAGAAACIRDHGATNLLVGDVETGRREIAESLVRCQACHDAVGAAWCYQLLGVAAFVLREYTEASSYFLESASQFESLGGNLGACHSQVDLGLSLRYEGKLPAALNAYRVALSYQRNYRFTTESADILEGLSAIAAALGQLDLAARLCGTASGWRETYQEDRGSPYPTTSTSRPLVDCRL